MSIDEAEKLLKILSIQEVGKLAKLDIHRESRKGIPEIVLAEGKTPEETVKIAKKLLAVKGKVIFSKASKSHIKALRKLAVHGTTFKVSEDAGVVVFKKNSVTVKKTEGKIGIITAGTSDIPIAEEAKIIAEEMGCQVLTAYDVGVAGIHRLFSPLQKMIKDGVGVIVVVAGMEGTLPSVVTGLVDVPVIGVPTSIGYGLGGGGVGALISMLQSCSLGLTVVNIDNGICAGATAALIANAKKRKN